MSVILLIYPSYFTSLFKYRTYGNWWGLAWAPSLPPTYCLSVFDKSIQWSSLSIILLLSCTHTSSTLNEKGQWSHKKEAHFMTPKNVTIFYQEYREKINSVHERDAELGWIKTTLNYPKLSFGIFSTSALYGGSRSSTVSVNPINEPS